MKETALGAIETRFAELIWEHAPLTFSSFPIDAKVFGDDHSQCIDVPVLGEPFAKEPKFK